MTENTQKMQPWQVFNAARKYLGASKVALIFNRQPRSAHDWAQDPTCTEQRCKSPLELLHALFLHMDTAGLGYVARAAIKYLETAVDPEVEMPDLIPLPANCLGEEVLKDYSAVAAMHTAIDNREGPELIMSKSTARTAPSARLPLSQATILEYQDKLILIYGQLVVALQENIALYREQEALRKQIFLSTYEGGAA